MDPEHDYYAILGVPSDADERAIKQAYRQLARRYHPDTSGEPSEPEGVERFREIQTAYELLIDPLQRERYDHWRRTQGLDRPPAFVVQTILSYEVLPCLGEEQAVYVLVKISAAEEIEGQRLPLNLCLVLDRSTSMKGARLQQVKEAARYIVEQLGPADVLSVVTFSDRAELTLPGRRGPDQVAARTALSMIKASGGTEIYQGLKMGLRELDRWRTEGAYNSLILLTDGQTYGDEARCLDEAREAGRQRIPLLTMGIGPEWNDNLLDQMAQLSGGASFYIDSAAKISRTFQEQIHRLGNLYAHDLGMLIHRGEGVDIKEIFRTSPEINPLQADDDRVSLGGLDKQQPQVLLLELLVSGRTPGQHRLLQVVVEGVVSTLGPSLNRARQDITVTFTSDLTHRPVVPPDIVSAMGKLTIYKIQERAVVEAEMGQLDAAVNRLKTLATRLLNVGEAELARAALLEAGHLSQTGSLSGEGRKKLRYGTRGLTIVPKEVRP